MVAPSDLDYFVGAWQVSAEDPTSGRRFAMSYTLERVLGGAWLIGSGRAPELGLEVHDIWGFDAASGELMRSIYQSDHNHGTVRSAGWDGDTLLLEGLVRTAGGELPVRETITRLGDDEFRAVWEMQGETGWAAYSVELATRSR